MRYELSDYEWTAIKPVLPNKPRCVRPVNDRRVLNGICCGGERPGSQRTMGRTRPATIASFGGGGVSKASRCFQPC
jgi:transposase